MDSDASNREITAAAELGHEIRRARKDAGLTQTDLAVASNVSVMAISRLERGTPTSRIDTILRVGKALGLHLVLTSGEQVDSNA